MKNIAAPKRIIIAAVVALVVIAALTFFAVRKAPQQATQDSAAIEVATPGKVYSAQCLLKDGTTVLGTVDAGDADPETLETLPIMNQNTGKVRDVARADVSSCDFLPHE